MNRLEIVSSITLRSIFLSGFAVNKGMNRPVDDVNDKVLLLPTGIMCMMKVGSIDW